MGKAHIEAPNYQYVIHRIELHQVRAVMPFRDLDDRLMDRVRGLAWQLSFNLGLKKSMFSTKPSIVKAFSYSQVKEQVVLPSHVQFVHLV